MGSAKYFCGEASPGAARHGRAGHGKHTASFGVQQFATAWRGWARRGAARLGMATHTASYGVQQCGVARQGMAWRGMARPGKANTQHPCGGAEVC